MKFSMDFSLIIGALVLVQLYILNIKVNEEDDDKPKKGINNDDDDIEGIQDTDGDLHLVVHRNNGEEKIYSKKDVA